VVDALEVRVARIAVVGEQFARDIQVRVRAARLLTVFVVAYRRFDGLAEIGRQRSTPLRSSTCSNCIYRSLLQSHVNVLL